jgi:dTDP-4-dehydrorhamnose reductase
MKILILGASGMLGHMVARHFLATGHDLYFTVNASRPAFLPADRTLRFNAVTDDPARLPAADYLINCIGLIKQKTDVPAQLYYQVNGEFPRRLAGTAKGRVIHITTDCVYSGATGKYDEAAPHDATDDYGKSKSQGECPVLAMCLRTSIIGPELTTRYGLLEFARTAAPPLRGFTNHWWNGITTEQFGAVCARIIKMDAWATGLWHLFSPRDVSKDELVRTICEVYGLGKQVIPHETPTAVDRTLRTRHNLCRLLNIPDIREQLVSIRAAEGGRAAA